MATERVEFVAGNFAPPNQDNNNKITSGVDVDGVNSAGRTALNTFVVQQIKSSVIQSISRIGATSGNRSRQEDLQTKLDIVGDLATLGVGFASGGLIGLGIAGGTIGVQKAFKAYDISIQ